MFNKRIYLDHSATTPVDKTVLDAMMPYLSASFGNPSSLHYFGREARKAVENARAQTADVIAAQPDEIYFTSGGTESDNTAVIGTAYANQKRGNHIITSKIEHHAVLNTCQFLEKKGFRVTYLPVDRFGVIDLDALKNAVTGKTTLISIMHVNNETGAIQPVEEIGKIAREHNIYFHTDAVQSFGKLPIDVNSMNIDLLSLSGHKVYAPKGTGALYIRKGTKIETLLHGGHHENGKRAGTENTAGIVGLGKAAELAKKDIELDTYGEIRVLRNYLQERILSEIDSVYLNGHPDNRLPAILNLCFEYIEGESIILRLDAKGIAVSSASACTSGSLEPSHVLIAMGVQPAIAQGSIRFSLGKNNTKEEMDEVMKILPEVISQLREMSPFSPDSPFLGSSGPRVRNKH